MSFFDELRGFLRTAGLIVRSHWNSAENDNSINDDNLSGDDEVVSAVANRNFALVYPPNQPWGTLNPLINTQSKLNALISFLGNFLLISSSAVITLLVGSIIMFGGFAFSGGIFPALEAYFSNIGLSLLVAGSGAALGVSLRKIDRVVTKRKCLESARDHLKDRKLYNQERCLISMERVDIEVEKQLDKYREAISEKMKKINTIKEMCKEIESINDLSQEKIEAELAPYKASIKGFTEEVKSMNKQMAKIRQNSAEIKADILKSQAMANVINVGEALRNLISGRSAAEIRELNESSKEILSLAESAANSLNDEILTEAGLITLDGDKPSKLLK
jgi:hypothetical protein